MNTNSIVMWVILQNNAGWDCFKTPIFSGDLEDSKSTSGGTLCVFGSHTFVPISWMCKKQTSVSHSSTESEVMSLDAGLRLDGIPALDLWALIVLVFGNTIQTHDRTGQPVVNCDKDHGPNKRSQGIFNILNTIDCVPSNHVETWQCDTANDVATMSSCSTLWDFSFRLLMDFELFYRSFELCPTTSTGDDRPIL